MLSVSKPMENVLHILFDSRLEMTLTMCRFQEYYESPYEHIKGRYFTMEEFIKAYAKPDGTIDYFNEWEGFNIPAAVLETTMGGFCGDRERMLVNLWSVAGKPAYVIATDKNSDETTLAHELCHAKMALNNRYNTMVWDALEGVDVRLFCKDLRDAGYPHDHKIMVDEINAYLVTSTEKELDETFPSVPLEVRQEIQSRLKAVHGI